MHEVSVVVPVYNEIENVDLMYQELVLSMKNQPRSYELVFVDDGSIDSTPAALREIAKVDQRVKLVLFKRNFGQTAAMMAGIEHAQGNLIVTIDGDLQNDPADIPMMLDKLDEGLDLVHGWRKNRQDKALTRKLPSTVANWIISTATGFPIHDLGCTLKAMRSDVAKKLELYGEMHRFIPILANQMGAKCAEVVTGHRARQFGTSKYGLGRTTRVILDLLTVKYLTDFKASPMKLLGTIGLAAGSMGLSAMSTAVFMWLTFGAPLLANPLLVFSVIGIAFSVQMLALGAIAETCVRIYFSAKDKNSYEVEERVNFETAEVGENTGDSKTQFPRLAA